MVKYWSPKPTLRVRVPSFLFFDVFLILNLIKTKIIFLFMERFIKLSFDNIGLYLFDLRTKLWLHCVLLPYLFSFFVYYLTQTLQLTLEIFGFTCPYEHAFFPYFEYLFFFFIALMHLRIYVNILILSEKNYKWWLFFYFFIFCCFLVWCDWYAYIHPNWNIEEQKYIYTLNFNVFGGAFIFFYCLFPFFIFDIFLILFFFYPLIALLFFTTLSVLFSFSDVTYPELWKIIHKILSESIQYIKNLFVAECMQSNSNMPNEKIINHSSVAETKAEALPKTSFQRAAEYLGDYRYEQKPIDCGENGVSVQYKQTPEGCRVTVTQCLPLTGLSESADAAIKNNLPSGYKGAILDHALGDPIRTATLPGIETSVELKETRCREISSRLLKSLEEYKKNT